MIVHDLDFGGIALVPFEANPIPVVDPDAVLANPASLESLQMQAWTFEVVKPAG
jgi:hypothetical protein